jgi:endonuclease III
LNTLLEQLAELQRFYGLLPFPPADAFQLYVWEVLSAKSTPYGRDAAMAGLRRAHALTPDAVVRAPGAKLTAAVAPAGGSIELRLSALRAGAEVFRRHPDLPDRLQQALLAGRRAIKRLPTLDQAAAHRALLFVGNRPVFPVDARVERVARRLGYAGGVSARPSTRAVRRALQRELPSDTDTLRHAFVYLEHHGAVTCTERDPHCGVCPLADGCPERTQDPRRT